MSTADEGRVQVESTGETVGEARWAALHELERRHPGLDRSQVDFVVLAEGERGLLGIGYEPARVLATLLEVPAAAAGRAPAPAATGRPRTRARPRRPCATCSSTWWTGWAWTPTWTSARPTSRCWPRCTAPSWGC